MKPKLLMVTAVWGEWHVKMLLNMNLASMLAPNNLSSLAEAADVTYLIYTTKKDSLKIDKARVIAQLRNYVEVQINILKNVDFSDPIGTHHKVWDWGIKRAKEQDMMVMFLPPDVAWSNRSFETIGDRLAKGYKVIMMTYLRAEEEEFQRSISGLTSKTGEILNLSGRKLIELCIASFHPLMAAYFNDSTHFPIHPEMMFWPVQDEGLLVRVFAREMFLFDPKIVQLNKQSLAEQKFESNEACFINDSDQLFAVSLAPINADLDWYLQPNEADAKNIAQWWLNYDSPANDFLVSHKIRWHYSSITEEKWQNVERKSDRFIRKTAVLREAFRIFGAADALNCKLAAKLIASSIYSKNSFFISKRINEGLLLFLPSDQVLSKLGHKYLDSCLSEQKIRTALLNTFRAHISKDIHVFQISKSEKVGVSLIHQQCEIEMVSGQKLQITQNDGKIKIGGAQIISEPVKVGSHLVFVIDSLLISKQHFN